MCVDCLWILTSLSCICINYELWKCFVKFGVLVYEFLRWDLGKSIVWWFYDVWINDYVFDWCTCNLFDTTCFESWLLSTGWRCDPERANLLFWHSNYFSILNGWLDCLLYMSLLTFYKYLSCNTLSIYEVYKTLLTIY